MDSDQRLNVVPIPQWVLGSWLHVHLLQAWWCSAGSLAVGSDVVPCVTHMTHHLLIPALAPGLLFLAQQLQPIENQPVTHPRGLMFGKRKEEPKLWLMPKENTAVGLQCLEDNMSLYHIRNNEKNTVYKSSLFAFAFIWTRTNSAVGFAFVCSQASPTVSWLTLSWAKSGSADILLQLTQSCETATHVLCKARSLIKRVCKKKGCPAAC